MIEGSTMRVGGRPLKHWIGTKLQSWGAKIANKNKHIMVTNPSCKLFNPFTLVVNFTVDNVDKYQIVLNQLIWISISGPDMHRHRSNSHRNRHRNSQKSFWLYELYN